MATPIGNPEDLSQRGLRVLREADLIVGEERKVLMRLLARLDRRDAPWDLINEHSTPEDFKRVAEQARNLRVCYVSDCGTPGFSDPGSELVGSCRKLGVHVTSVPGASALSVLLSLSSQKITRFEFLGFPPRDAEERLQFMKSLAINPKRCTVLMDTPYRLEKIMEELASVIPKRKMLLAMDLTKESELVLEGTCAELKAQVSGKEREFMILLYG